MKIYCERNKRKIYSLVFLGIEFRYAYYVSWNNKNVHVKKSRCLKIIKKKNVVRYFNIK